MTLSNSSIIGFFSKYWILILFFLVIIILLIAYYKGAKSNSINTDVYNYGTKLNSQ